MDVELERVVPRGVVAVDELARGERAGVVDDDVEPAEGVQRHADQRPHLLAVGGVERVGVHAARVGGGQLVQRVLAARGGDDAGALGDQRLDGRAAQPAAGARDDRDAARELQVHQATSSVRALAMPRRRTSEAPS